MKNFYRQGQALVTLLVFMIIAMTITSASIVIMVLNSQNTYKFQDSLIAYNIAESGMESATLRLLRDPGYNGETIDIGEGTATVTISGTNPIIATSSGRLRNFLRKIQMTANYNNGFFTISSWKEIF